MKTKKLQKTKMAGKIDYFYIITGICFLILAVWMIIKKSYVFAFIDSALAIMSFFKGHYQEKMSIISWIKNKK